MPYIYFNPNPRNIRVGDCSVRAIAKALDVDWENAYISLCAEGLNYCDMPSANYVWGMLLHKKGFTEHMVSHVCPACVTVAQFAEDHPNETYVLATQNHVVCVENGDYFDTWDSGEEVVLYFYSKEN